MFNNSEFSFRCQKFRFFLGIAMLSTLCPTTIADECKSNIFVDNNAATQAVSEVLKEFQKVIPDPQAEKKMDKPKETPQMEMEKKPEGTEEEEEVEVELPEETTGGPDLTIRKFKAMPDTSKIINNAREPKSSIDEKFKGLSVVMVYSNYVDKVQLFEAKWDNTDLELEGVKKESNVFDDYGPSPTWSSLGQDWEPALAAGITLFESKILKAKEFQQKVVEADQRFYYAGVVTAYRKEDDQTNSMMRLDIQIVPMPEELVNSP